MYTIIRNEVVNVTLLTHEECLKERKETPYDPENQVLVRVSTGCIYAANKAFMSSSRQHLLDMLLFIQMQETLDKLQGALLDIFTRYATDNIVNFTRQEKGYEEDYSLRGQSRSRKNNTPESGIADSLKHE